MHDMKVIRHSLHWCTTFSPFAFLSSVVRYLKLERR